MAIPMTGVARRLRCRVGAVVAVGVLAASGVGVMVATTSTAQASSKPAYTFVLSNNFLGNDWRPQVERLAQLTADVPPFKGVVNLKVVNSTNTNQAQIADLNSIIETKPSAILLLAGSSTALEPDVERACAAGILVLTLSTPIGASCAINLDQNFYQGNQAMGQWMAKVDPGHGKRLRRQRYCRRAELDLDRGRLPLRAEEVRSEDHRGGHLRR